MNDTEADQEFLDHLEWQTRSAVRRANRFSRPVRTGHRLARAATVVLISALCGASGAVAAERIHDGQDKHLHLLREHSRLELAETRREIAAEEMLRRKREHDAGVVDVDTLFESEARLVVSEQAVHRHQLNLEEIRLTSIAPDDALDAPRIRGRDFVSERLELALREARFALDDRLRGLERAASRADAGLAGEGELRALEVEVLVARGALERVERQLELREAFLEGSVARGDLLRLTQAADARTKVREAHARVDLAGYVMTREAELVERGLAPRDALRRAELARSEAEAELRIAAAEAAHLDPPVEGRGQR